MELDEDGDLVLQRHATGHDRPDLPCDQGASDTDLVLSEVHLEQATPKDGGPMVTTFWHGDQVLEVGHGHATPLALVGLQVWRGALLLGDYILNNQHLLSGCTVLELGAGPGVAGLLAAGSARLVFLTDVGSETLRNCQSNAARNAARLHGGLAAVRVRQLDWLDPPNWLALDSSSRGRGGGGRPAAAAGSVVAAAQQGWECPSTEQHFLGQEQEPQQQRGPRDDEAWSWQPADVVAVAGLRYLLAADVVYDDHLTEAFMRTAVALLRHAACGAQHAQQPRLLVALERRVNFTLRDMEARAPAYDYWRGLFTEVQGQQGSPKGAAKDNVDGGAQPAPAVPSAEASGRSGVGPTAQGGPGPHFQAGNACGGPGRGKGAARVAFPLAGQRLEVESIPQQLHRYERSDYLELWELWLSE